MAEEDDDDDAKKGSDDEDNNWSKDSVTALIIDGLSLSLMS